MGWTRNTTRERRTAGRLAAGLAVLAVAATVGRPASASDLLQDELIVMRVQRGQFPEVRLWMVPASAISLGLHTGHGVGLQSESDVEEVTIQEAVPNYYRGPGGAITNLQHPRNIRNIGAYYLEAGDHFIAMKATRNPKTSVWVLDDIQRVATQKPPILSKRNRNKRDDSLAVEMLTDKQAYRPGEPIRMTLRARNSSTRPITLVFPTGETHEMAVRMGFQELWHLSTLDQINRFGETRRKLKPGETIEFTAVWDQKTRDGAAAGPGFYFATGKVLSKERIILGDKRTGFRILAPNDAQAKG
jgi:Intracellular proteinase inhibitor